jgi:hypothetical protein
MSITKCQWCSGTKIIERLCSPEEVEKQKKYGRYICEGCNRQLGWMPFPAQPMPSVALPWDRFRAILQGTPAQVLAAQSIRREMLSRLSPTEHKKEGDIIRAVVDASWFFGNAKRRLNEIRWPTPQQIDSRCLCTPKPSKQSYLY